MSVLKKPTSDTRGVLGRRKRVLARLGDATGNNIVEAAFALPLFLLLIFSIIDFACIFYVHLALENGISQATRFTVTGNVLPNPEPGHEGQFLNREDSIKLAMRNATPTLTIPDDAITIQHLPDGEDTWLNGAGEPGDIVRARVDYDWDILTPLMKPFFDHGQIQLTAESAMKNESRFE
jgi:hypothetical protein